MLPTPTSSAMLLYKVNSSTTARMRGRLVLNGSTEIRGSFGEISGDHVSEATVHWLQTMVPLSGGGDTVGLQGTFRVADGYFAADHTSFWERRSGERWWEMSKTPPIRPGVRLSRDPIRHPAARTLISTPCTVGHRRGAHGR